MIRNTQNDTTDVQSSEITDVERACIKGHPVERRRLEALGRSEDDIDDLVNLCDSFEDFARVVQDSYRWEREKQPDE